MERTSEGKEEEEREGQRERALQSYRALYAGALRFAAPLPSYETAEDNIIPARRSLLHARSPKLGEILKSRKVPGNIPGKVPTLS